MSESPEVRPVVVLVVVKPVDVNPVVVLSLPVDVNVYNDVVRVSLVPEPAEKKASSERSVDDPWGVELPRALGGGVTKTSLPSDEPLDTVTGEPPRITRLANPRPGLAPRARSKAEANS